MLRSPIVGLLACLGGLAAQETPRAPTPKPAVVNPRPRPASVPDDKPRLQNVQFDAGGWPIGPEDPPLPAAPAAETSGGARAKAAVGKDAEPKAGKVDAASAKPPRGSAVRDGGDVPQLASGTQLGSPLLDIFQATHGPGEWKQLGGVVVWWRVTIYGASGEELGVREITHRADTAFTERDRLEHGDGRVLARLGSQVFAERNGMPLPTAAEQAGRELLLFGTQLRLPWLFGDANAFVVVGKDVEERNGERWRKVVVEPRPPAGSEVFGPELEPKPRDRFELLYEPSSGLPREFVHRLACSLQTRRVLLEDWREFAGVRLPFRRVYVDEAMRETTSLEILRIERQRVSERDFRLL